MIQAKQRTLKNTSAISGIGLHTGQVVKLTFHPAPENTGILFRRTDIHPAVTIPATTQYVSDTRLNTCLTYANTSIATIEHLLSAIAGLGIDNLYIDIDAAEIPIMDGSAWPFVELFLSTGIAEQHAKKQFLRMQRKITVEEGNKFISLAPFDGFKVSMTIDFNHPAIAQTQQFFSIDFTQHSYADEISTARTFGFLSEYEYLRQNNLGLGASLENTIVLNDTEILNTEGLRNQAEFVKHKILDAVGDLRLLGYNLLAECIGHKSGHALNHRLRQALLDDPTAWELINT
jgi:UDP-3-O-[3-hydroxymyristoyl] N-acetylglucosamine deacetylase